VSKILFTAAFIFCFCTMVNGQNRAIYKIAFGSCSEQRDPDQMWAEVLRQKPNLWMWLGDNIYADTHNMDSMRAYYSRQKNQPDYQKMKQSFPIIGTWDDHDYASNDAGKFFSKKNESKENFLEFLDIPPDADVRKHEGVYQSFVFGTGKQKIKIILLDTRSFRDTVIAPNGKGNGYVPNPEGDVLGEAQWLWLENELRNSDARLHIVVSSIQFLANDHVFEKWGNFPKARQRMMDLLVKSKPTNTIIVSGDRHVAELSKLNLQGLSYPLYDLTSSSLTRPWAEPRFEKNSLRVGNMIYERNYGIIMVDWGKKGPMVTLQVKGKNNAVYLEEKIDFGGRNNR